MDKKYWTIKGVKRRGRATLKRNYIICVIVCVIVAVLIGTHPFINTQFGASDFNNTEVVEEVILSPRIDGYSNSQIVEIFVKSVDMEANPIYNFLGERTGNYTEGALSNLVKSSVQSESVIFGILNALNQFIFKDRIFAGVIISIGVFFMFIYYIVAGAILGIGEKRFFMESGTYPKTTVSKLFFLIRVRRLKNPVVVMTVRFFLTLLWFLTIVGGFIKLYSYRMVPYILAENPELNWKTAINLSREMMAGNKWKTFLLDLTFFAWYALSLLTFGVLAVLYINPYKTATGTELYLTFRREVLRKAPENSFYFNDLYLDTESDLAQYPVNLYHIFNKPHKLFSLDYKRNYSLTNLILLFFGFSLVGWLWEVILQFFQTGEFVNRGVLLGPWLPIYGTGGILILLLLKRWRDKPLVSFAGVMVICGVIEYTTAWYLETFKNNKWWDYTGYLLNLDGRICLEGILVFGLGGLAFIYFLAPLMDSLLNKLPLGIRRTLCVILVMLFLADIANSHNNPNTGNGITKNV